MSAGQLIYQLLAIVGGVSAVTGLIIAVAQFLGKRWVEDRFERNFAKYRHELETELRRLTIEIDGRLNAIKLLQDREFESLSKAWELLNEAYFETESLVALYEEFPDVDRASENELEEILSMTKFSESQKSRIRNAPKKFDEYRRIEFAYRCSKTMNSHVDFRRHYLRYSIFFPPEIRHMFDEIIRGMRSVAVDRQIGTEEKDYRMRHDAWKKFDKDVRPTYERLEAALRDRLTSHSRVSASFG